jgi:transglutaminase-like putative cysteine protease
VFDEGLWGPVVVAVAVVAIASAAAARSFGSSRAGARAGARAAAQAAAAAAVSLIAALVGALLALTLFFAADTAFLGIIPLPGTVTRFAELISAGEVSIAEQSIPAAADDGILFILAVGIGLMAILVDAALVNGTRPAFAAVPLLSILSVPIVLAPGELPLLAAVGTGVAFLLMLALHRPAASGGPAALGRAVTVAAGVLIAALIVPPLLPPVVAGSALPGAGLAGLVTGVNPVLELGNDLRRDTPVTALRYTTDAEGGLYLTLSHLADFEGQAVQPVIGGDTTSVDVVGPPPWLDDAVATTAVTTSIQLQNVRSRWVPLPSAPVEVSGLSGDWVVDPEGVTLSTVEGSFRGGDYVVESLVAEPTPVQLRAATVTAAGLERYRALPEELEAIVADTAAEVAAGAAGSSPYDQALALQRFFTGGDFLYSEDAPVEFGYDGTGADIVAVFLEERAGYCVHYAAAMALMARTLGIPARIAVGFQPGTRNPDVPSEFVVSTDDLHAWPELHFDGLGWVRFEPTPSRGAVPAYAADSVPPPSATDPVTGEPIEATDAPVSPTDPADNPDANAPNDDPDADRLDLIDGGNDGSAAGNRGEAGLLGGAIDTRLLAALLLALLFALLALPAVWRGMRRSTRLRSPDVLDHWRELRDTARDLRVPGSEMNTPRELGELWRTGWSVADTAALTRLRSALEVRSYAAVTPSASAAAAGAGASTVNSSETRQLLTALRRATPWRSRALAAVLPVSLRRGTGQDEQIWAQ